MSAHLQTGLRNQLARAIQGARRTSEEGARKALASLAVGDSKPYAGMTETQRRLRRQLRAHGRQLGDRPNGRTGEQETDRLTHETAYEHWHRMLFAWFLAENELLVEPESGVPVSLAECEELARERGEDPWEAAGRWASEMLPEIFRPDDPVLAVQLPPETRQSLQTALAELPPAVFTADDSLGWTYQFWQAERKDAVNQSGVKIGADELPAVTQLFTERYMVLFLLHNTVGAWRAGRILSERPDLAEAAESEDELRDAVRLRAGGGYDFSYLRFVREPAEDDEEDEPTGPWRPAAGAFEGWPRTAAELRVLDPCCGSGHFLVEALNLLVRLRMEEEGLAIGDALRKVLRGNLFGLEIDPRCTQIAAFNVALAAWKMAGDPIELPPLEIACSGLAPNSTLEEWLDLAHTAAAAGGIPAKRDLLGTEENLLSAAAQETLGELHGLFEQAPVLGSLIDPRASSAQGDVFRKGLRLGPTPARRDSGPRGTRRGADRTGGLGERDGSRRTADGRPLHARDHQRALPRERQTVGRSVALLRIPSRAREGRSRHRLRIPYLRMARRSRHAGRGDPSELAVPDHLSEAARKTAQGPNVEPCRAIGRACLR